MSCSTACGRALAAQAGQLEALSHARVLERGYAIVRGRVSGHVIPRLAAVGAETELDIVFADGELPVRRADKAAQAARSAGAPSRAACCERAESAASIGCSP